MMRDERHAVVLADAFPAYSTAKFGVCTPQGGVNAAGLEYASGPLPSIEDSSLILCLTDSTPAGQTATAT
jgi:hypothetical protein